MDIRKSLDSLEEMSIDRAEEAVELDSETLRHRKPPLGAVRVTDEISEAIDKTLKKLRKQFSENGTMDRFKEIFNVEVKCDSHKNNIDKLHHILTSSGDQVSYEDAFKELGGPEFRSRVSDEVDLDGILQKLIQEKHIALPEEEKKRLFKKWDEELHRLQ